MGFIKDIAFGRISSPDLDLQEQFLLDFGMVRVARTDDALYMRGTDPEHHVHVTHLGDADWIGLAFEANSADALTQMSQKEGASAIEDIDEPGGGKRVRFTDPEGKQIEVVHGIEELPKIPVRKVLLNQGDERFLRTGVIQRVPKGPSHVKRSAHCVFKTTDIAKTNGWYQEILGLQTTDRIHADTPEDTMAIFNHIDSDNEFVDHHVMLSLQHEEAGYNHLSFEVEDVDDVQLGHEFLTNTGKYKHAWGVGRHYLGSQIFDYWRDPWGRIHEHWTDSDRVNNSHTATVHSPEEGLQNQWGPEFPWEFIDDPSKHTNL
jgi:catechol 2,3-dioxygenase-like lactoylglutathione lyase family enzyme